MEEEDHRLEDLVDPPHMRAEIIFAVLSFAIAVVLAMLLGSQLTWQPGKPFTHQPGFFTTIAIVGMLVCGVFELYFTWQRNKDGKGEPIVGEVNLWLLAVEYAVWFMAYVLAVPYIGYLAATVTFCLLLTWRLGYRSNGYLLAAFVFGVVTVLVFKSFLAVKIPGGAVYEYAPEAIRNVLIIYF